MIPDKKVIEIPRRIGVPHETTFSPIGQSQLVERESDPILSWLKDLVNTRITNLNGQSSNNVLPGPGVFEIMDHLKNHSILNQYIPLKFIFFKKGNIFDEKYLHEIANQGIEISEDGSFDSRLLAHHILSTLSSDNRIMQPLSKLKDYYLAVSGKMGYQTTKDHFYLAIGANGLDRLNVSVVNEHNVSEYHASNTTINLRKTHPSALTRQIVKTVNKLNHFTTFDLGVYAQNLTNCLSEIPLIGEDVGYQPLKTRKK